ncbi:MAG: hypothetical protein AAB664_03135 [Patescibacteria group bacterium]|mgnify:CR=1 FL=1
MESAVDRKKLNELIRNVITRTKPSDAQRRGLERTSTPKPLKKIESQTSPNQENSFDRTSYESYFSESNALYQLEVLLQTGVHIDEIAQCLSGLESNDAWNLRDKLNKLGANPNMLLLGLAGLDSDRAWAWRNDLSTNSITDDRSIIKSVAGLDSVKAWQWRDKYDKSDEESKGDLILSLVGVDSERAWSIRKANLKKGKHLNEIVQSLAGLDSDQAWSMRDNLKNTGANDVFLIRSLTGLDSEKANYWRDNFFPFGLGQGTVSALLQSYAGVSSLESWRKRKLLLEVGVDADALVRGFAGITIIKFDNIPLPLEIKKIVKESANLDMWAQGINGTWFTGIAWRTAQKQNQNPPEFEIIRKPKMSDEIDDDFEEV